jgi:hypothetical protein
MPHWLEFDTAVWLAWQAARDATSTETLLHEGEILKVAGCTFRWAPQRLIITHTWRHLVTAVAEHAVSAHALHASVLARQLWANQRKRVQVDQCYVDPTTAIGQQCMRDETVPRTVGTWAAAGPYQPKAATVPKAFGPVRQQQLTSPYCVRCHCYTHYHWGRDCPLKTAAARLAARALKVKPAAKPTKKRPLDNGPPGPQLKRKPAEEPTEEPAEERAEEPAEERAEPLV